MNFAHALLTHRRLPLIIAILAIILTLPSLNVGLALDDYHHKLAIKGSDSVIRLLDSPFDLFRFFDGSDPQRMHKIIDYGLFPWWTYPKAKGALWRPLTCLTHWLDYKLWPNIVPLMHAQSILWYGALVAAVTLLYRRFMGLTIVAGLAALLYAVDDAHGTPICFLANRNTLLATFFGVLTIIAHDRWRRNGWRMGALFGPVLLALSLLSKEAGIATCAYLFAHVIFVDRSHWAGRLAALIPYLVVVILWRTAWTKLGYGIENVGGYIDPLKNAVGFIGAVKHRLPFLLLGQWALPPADISCIVEPQTWIFLYRGALIFLVLSAVILIPLLWRNRTARFWAAGMVLSAIPICATWPQDRLLFFVGIGAMGLLAQFLNTVFGNNQWRPKFLLWHIPAVLLGVLFILIHLIIAPITLPIRTSFALVPKQFADQLQLTAPMDNSIVNQDLIVVNPPVALLTSFAPFKWEACDEPVPRHFRVLTSSLFRPVKVHRPDEKTLLVRPEYGYYAWVGDQIFRSPKHPMLLGQRVELTGMTVEITELTPDGRPYEAAFTFDVPLEDPSLRWLQFKDGAFVPFTPPAIGQTIELHAHLKF